jgi:hypothetical protein
MPGNDGLTTKELRAGYLNWNSEKAADKLALEWGFTLPAYRKTKKGKGASSVARNVEGKTNSGQSRKTAKP